MTATLTQLIPLTPLANPQLQDIRTQAAAYLQEETIPTNKNEEWRFTNLSPLLAQTFARKSRQLTLRV
jgi:Fe-S cluster assembly protein SufD